nr:hypothetical protein [Hahella ganghwensis]
MEGGVQLFITRKTLRISPLAGLIVIWDIACGLYSSISELGSKSCTPYKYKQSAFCFLAMSAFKVRHPYPKTYTYQSSRLIACHLRISRTREALDSSGTSGDAGESYNRATMNTAVLSKHEI